MYYGCGEFFLEFVFVVGCCVDEDDEVVVVVGLFD